MKKTYLFCILFVEAAGFAAGMLTRNGTQIYAETINKPPLSPPGIVFPIAWTILYCLMAIGLAKIISAEQSSARTKGIVLFGIQLALNLIWCFIFFGVQRFDLALVDLILMLLAVLAMTYYFKKSDVVAARIQIPYIVWLFFAAYLNIGVIALN